jgi:hypothetical protein
MGFFKTSMTTSQKEKKISKEQVKERNYDTNLIEECGDSEDVEDADLSKEIAMLEQSIDN